MFKYLFPCKLLSIVLQVHTERQLDLFLHFSSRIIGDIIQSWHGIKTTGSAYVKEFEI